MPGTIRATLAIVALFALAGTASGEEAAPSFDCARATSQVERLICARPALAEADVSIDKLYKERRMALDVAARALLVRDQMGFLSARDRVFEEGLVEPEALLADLLTDRTEFLREFHLPPPNEFEGRWRQFGGQVRITAEANGLFGVDITGVEPLAGRWICDARATGRMVDGVLEATVEEDGSRLRMARTGAALEIEALPPPNEPDWLPRYCGLNGTAAGAYFPVSPKPLGRT